MELNIEQIESALQTEKAEIDELDLKLRSIRSAKDKLRPDVQKYDALKKEEKSTRKLRNAKYSLLKIHTEFVELATGSFPDGMFSLFSEQNKTHEPHTNAPMCTNSEVNMAVTENKTAVG